jgi:ureidoglycolate dehydrogenase (NAD+)
LAGSESPIVAAPALREFIAVLLAAAGFGAEHARTCAEVLVWADLRGQGPHGVARAPSYIDMPRRGVLDPHARIDVEVMRAGVARVNARRALGPAALARAAEVAIERAREAGTAWVFVQDHGHGGAIGYYARQVAEQGMLAIMLTASRPMMAYHGSTGPVLATSPLAIAVPGGGLLDMSTAAIAMGKIAAARSEGRALSPGVAVDRDGNPTTDAAAAVTPLPLGGAKGSGLALMIEALTSVALANPLLASALRDPAQMEDYRLNSVLIALDLQVLGGPDVFAQGFAELAAAIKAQPRSQGVDELLLPGERGDRESVVRAVVGVPVAAATWAKLGELARHFGVPLPAPVAPVR